MKKALPLALLFALLAPAALAQDAKPANPGVTAIAGLYGFAKTNLLRSAEKMPEENYAFKPTPDVRSFGQLVGHVIDSQYLICGTAMGEKPQGVDAEKTKTSKADLVAALKESIAYCDKAFKQTDAEASAPVKLFGMDVTRMSALGLAMGHGFEHYGNMVTYLRLKGIVPPSSEPRTPPAPPAEKKAEARPVEKK